MKLYTRTVILTAAQVNALDSTAITVIPAPSNSNTVIQVESVRFAKLSGTAAGTCSTAPITTVYTGETTAIAGFASAANTQTFMSTGAAAATYLVAIKKPAVDFGGAGIAQADIVGKGIDITGAGASIAAFDGTMQVTISFYMVNIENS